jgi:nicotinic acid phosphoribosyltransferase
MVYKLVEVNGVSRIKLSEEGDKTMLPSTKKIFRIYRTLDANMFSKK